ncbi:MAG: argininosuccinate lyase [Chloroflexi bacterium]|nr:argininosuccinate lyase [Chloroflexota bacterium]
MQLWGGRFNKSTDKLVQMFNSSLGFDKRLYQEDITASCTWTKGLERAGVLTTSEAKTILNGLAKVRSEFAENKFIFHENDEDIHTAVERRLTEIIGAVAGKLHTGRSRNDQVATDFRLWTMHTCSKLVDHIINLQSTLIDSATENLNTPMPGYTHLQPAQPITWGLWSLSHFWPLQRDIQRLTQVKERASSLPLGSAALAGTSFAIDRAELAADLEFNSISENSLDAVSDRDFAAEFLFTAAMIGIHLSRLSEQLILFSSSEFGFVSLDDAYTTGSSLLPQKKNPDTLELTRGKSGRLIGNLTGLLTTLKGLPSAYDKDLQEDKEYLFDSTDTLILALPVMSGVISTLKLNTNKMLDSILPALSATDMADYLVDKGIPFREAHGIVGELVLLAEKQEQDLTTLSLHEMQSISQHFAEDVMETFDTKKALERRAIIGGTSSKYLDIQLQSAKESLANFNA